MTELKCPFCNLDIRTHRIFTDGCDNTHSPLWQELICTRKKLDICVKALNKIANTDIKVIEKEPRYYARAMFSVTNNALGRIQDTEQKDKK